MSEKSENGVTITEKSVNELLVTSLMPTSKYIETRFDHLQVQIDSIVAVELEKISSGLKHSAGWFKL